VVPSIHTLTGTSVQNAVLLRGIDLAHYQETELFTLTAGRSLQPGDAERLAMVGSRLLETKGITVGDAIQLRGRDFTVVGIFHTGSYVDNEAWISLADAQRLLGWGEDVSVYLVPDEGILEENSVLPGGISVVRKGEGVRGVVFQYEPLIDLMSLVSLMLGAVVVLSMANIFLRLAWLRRRELAILRTVGFPPFSLAGYLFAQVGGITLAGLLLSALATQGIIAGEKLTVAGFSIAPRLEAATVVSSLGWAVFIMLAGSLLPALWISRMNLSGLLHSE
jgi:putative ABC transport system permease protein